MKKGVSSTYVPSPIKSEPGVDAPLQRSSCKKHITLKSTGYSQDDYFLHQDICAPVPSDMYNPIRDNYIEIMKGNIPDKAYRILPDDKKFIIGHIYKKQKQQGLYKVCFEFTGIPHMIFEGVLLYYLMNAYKKIQVDEQSMSKCNTPVVPIISPIPMNVQCTKKDSSKSPLLIRKSELENLEEIDIWGRGSGP